MKTLQNNSFEKLLHLVVAFILTVILAAFIAWDLAVFIVWMAGLIKEVIRWHARNLTFDRWNILAVTIGVAAGAGIHFLI